MVALLAARNAGVGVPEQAIQNGIKFYLSCQTPDGGIGYISPTGPNATRTAIGCLVLALAKEKDSAAFRAGFNYLKNSADDSQYPHYYKYYASQAFFHGSPDLWQSWNRDNIRALRSTQTPEGSWEGQFGSTYGTAFSLLSLALNYRYLPIYER
jgi:squalene cyclase